MKYYLLLALPMLATASLANSAASTPVPEPVEAAEGVSTLTQVEEHYTHFMRDEYHTPLNGILAFVHDKATADAAAPRVKVLLDSPGGKDEKPNTKIILNLCYGHDCFASSELKEALSPFLKANESEKLKTFRQTCLPLLEQMTARMDALSAEMEAVANADAAARVATALSAFPGSLKELELQLEPAIRALEPGMNDIYLIMATAQGRLVGVCDRFIHAYGHAIARTEGGFPKLKEAFQQLWSQSGMPGGMVQSISAESVQRSEKLVSALREWLNLAATIHDQASADAAADWLERKNEELGTPLLNCWIPGEHKSFCPCLAPLGIITENAINYLQYASPSFYGSDKLRTLIHPIQPEWSRDTGK